MLRQRPYSARSTVLTGGSFFFFYYFLLFISAVNLFANFQRWWQLCLRWIYMVGEREREKDLQWFNLTQWPCIRRHGKPGWESKGDPVTAGLEPYSHPHLQLNQPGSERLTAKGQKRDIGSFSIQQHIHFLFSFMSSKRCGFFAFSLFIYCLWETLLFCWCWGILTVTCTLLCVNICH